MVVGVCRRLGHKWSEARKKQIINKSPQLSRRDEARMHGSLKASAGGRSEGQVEILRLAARVKRR